MKIIELKRQQSEARSKMLGVYQKANNAERPNTPEEMEEVRQLEQDIDALGKRIIQLEAEERLNAQIAANKKPEVRHKAEKETEETKIKKRYSFARAIRMKANGQNLDGVEAEMHQEAEQEAQRSGLSLQGLGVPSMFMQLPEKRDMVVGTTTAGGHLVQTTVGSTIEALRPRLQTIGLGAQTLTGLVGNLDLPRHNGVTSAAWEGEVDANAESTPTLDKISLTPNRLGAYTEYSKQLVAQAENESIENFIRRDLESAIRIAVDLAALNGSGSGNQPTGILNTSDIGDVAGGTNGATPTFANIVALETAVAVDNADMGALAYLTTPGIRGLLKVTEKASNTAQFVWNGDLNGYRAEVSTQVPSTLDKGTATGVCHAILFGNWNELIIANWAGLDIVVDPYTLAKNAKLQIVVNSWWDVAVRHAESFAAMKDALTS